MSVEGILDYGYKFSCQFCTAVRVAFVAFIVGAIALAENAGRARAANELARMGKIEEAKALMLEVQNAKKN
jgi:hypothetical protein